MNFPMGHSLGGNLHTKRTRLPIRLSYASSVQKEHGLALGTGVVGGLAKDSDGGNPHLFHHYHL